MSDSKTKNLAILTLVMVVIGFLVNFTARQELLLASIPILGLVLSFKMKGANKDHDYLVAAILGGLSCIYHAIYVKSPQWIYVFASTYIGYVAAAPVFRKYLDMDKLVGDRPGKSVAVAIVVGLLLGVINILLGGGQLALNFTPENFIAALTPGIYEEAGIRFLLYGWGIYLLKGRPAEKIQNILLYILMIVPHLVGHTGIGIGDFIVLFLLFGIPLSLAQRKLSLSSAIIIHIIIDFMRFASFGIF